MSIDRDSFRNYGIYFVEMERRMYWNESYHCNERVYFAVVPVRATGRYCGSIPAGELVFEGTREVGIDAPLYISGRDRVPFREAYPREKLGDWIRKNLGKDLPNVPGFLSLPKAEMAKYLKMAGCPVSLATKLQPPQVLEGMQAVFIGSFSQDDKIEIMTLVKSHGGDCHSEVRPKFKYTHVVEGTTVTTQWGGTQGRGSKKWKQAVKSGARVVSPAWIKSTVVQLVANAKAAKQAKAAVKASNKAKTTTKKSKKRASKSQPEPAAATTGATASTTTASTTSTAPSPPESAVAGGGAGGGAGAAPGGAGAATAVAGATTVTGDASGPTSWLDEHSDWAAKEEEARKVRAAERKAKIAANKAKREAEKAAKAARAGPPTRRSSRVRRSRDMLEAEQDTSAAASAASAATASAATASAASDSASTTTSNRPTKRNRRRR